MCEIELVHRIAYTCTLFVAYYFIFRDLVKLKCSMTTKRCIISTRKRNKSMHIDCVCGSVVVQNAKNQKGSTHFHRSLNLFDKHWSRIE